MCLIHLQGCTKSFNPWNIFEKKLLAKIYKKKFQKSPKKEEAGTLNMFLFLLGPAFSIKLQRIWSWNFGFPIRKIWAFIWYQKIYYFRLSPGGWEYDRHKVFQVFNYVLYSWLHGQTVTVSVWHWLSSVFVDDDWIYSLEKLSYTHIKSET